MIKMLQALENELALLEGLDKVRPITKIDELEGFDKYAITYEIAKGSNHKKVKGKQETPIFINSYSNLENGDIAVLQFAEKVKSLLNEGDISDSNIRSYMAKYQSSHPQPKMNSRLQAWQTVQVFMIRWEVK